jgi:peptidyl-prolyl cis-trans isomerase SurA
MNRPRRPKIAYALLLLGLIPAVAAAVTLTAVVNGVPITSYDIDQRVALMTISGQSAGRTGATNQLIDEAIQITEAQRFGIAVSSQQVSSAFNNIAQQVGLSVSQFEQALWEAGVAPDTLRNSLRAQIYWSILVQGRLQAAPAVRQADVTAQLLAQGGAAETVREYQMQRIIFVVPAGAGNSYVNQRRSEAQSFRQRFADCSNTLAQAANLTDVTVRDIGRDIGQLNQAQQNDVRSTAAGRTTGPERTDLGIEVIAVCSVTEVQANEAARTEIQNDLLIDQGEVFAQDYLAELRERAIIIRY